MPKEVTCLFREHSICCHFPTKKYFRNISRALRSIVYILLRSWAIVGLVDVSHFFRQGFSNLVCPFDHKCVKCPTHMSCPRICISDASQACEMMKHSVIKKNLDYTLHYAERSGHSLQQVFRTHKAICGSTKLWHREKDDRIVLASNSIRTCLQSYIDVRIFKVGDTFVRQERGAPIGGPMSSALLD
eukprot:3870049-Karenia_brevis.AAC.1